MILLESDWDKIKGGWSKNDQLTLMHARCGQSIVPRAYLINAQMMPQDLVIKLRVDVANLGSNLDGIVATGTTQADEA